MPATPLPSEVQTTHLLEPRGDAGTGEKTELAAGEEMDSEVDELQHKTNVGGSSQSKTCMDTMVDLNHLHVRPSRPPGVIVSPWYGFDVIDPTPENHEGHYL